MKTILAVSLVCVSFACASAQTYIVHTTDDGQVFYNNRTLDSSYLITSPSNIYGDIHFAAFNASADSSIELEISPYVGPISSPVYVYGFDNATALLSGSDYNAGTFLGTWNVVGLNDPQEAFFDVTLFVQSVQGQYFGFELRSDGTDVFSSTAKDNGAPPELIVTEEVPEPSTPVLCMIGLGAVLFGLVIRKQRGLPLQS